VKIAIQAVTQVGTTTRPNAAMPSPAIRVAATIWLCAPSDVKEITGSVSHSTARNMMSPTMNSLGSLRPDRPTWVIAWVRASCIATRLTAPTATTHPLR